MNTAETIAAGGADPSKAATVANPDIRPGRAPAANADIKPGRAPAVAAKTELNPSRAAAADIARLLTPGSIAIIGASADTSKFSGRFAPYLQRQGYAGAIYPINARRSEVAGLKAYADLAAIPGAVDCAIYSIAAGDIEPWLAACEAKGVQLLVITSAGFAERGDDEGARLQALVSAFARRTGIRVIGPNCVGFVNLVARVAAAAAAVLEWPDIPMGRIGVVSQSGGLGMGSVLFGGLREDIAFSYLVSTGNEADLDLVDFGRFLVEDPSTDVIALTIEAVRDGAGFRAFLAGAQATAKPVVILKSARSELGRAMAASHTGALAGSSAIFSALCARYGAVQVDDVDELYQVAQMFVKLRAAGKLSAQRVLPADGCAALSVSGGHVGLLADMAALRGMRFPPLAETTQQQIRTVLGKDGEILNPVDLSGGQVADHSVWGRCLQPLLDDPETGIVVPILTVARNYDVACHDIVRIAAGQSKPVLVSWVGGSFEGEGKAILRRSAVPIFETPERAVRALAALDTHLRARVPSGRDPFGNEPNARPYRGLSPPHPLIQAALAAGRTTLGERESKTILAELGFPVTRERLVTSASEAVDAAQALGFPVALKGEHPDIAHKTEAGLVRLGVVTPAEVVRAFSEIDAAMRAHSPAAPGAGVLVQEMVPSGTELALGIQSDANFGPAVLFGLGGIFIEVLRDVRLAVAPLTHAEALEMIGQTRCVALLQGARGRHPVSLAAIADLLVALGDFALTHAGFVREIDINPLIAIDRPLDNLRVVDALMILNVPAKGYQ